MLDGEALLDGGRVVDERLRVVLALVELTNDAVELVVAARRFELDVVVVRRLEQMKRGHLTLRRLDSSHNHAFLKNECALCVGKAIDYY